MTVDVSRGKGMDYSAFSIFDCTETPYKQVVTFRSNEIPPMVFPTVINRMSDVYNEALILVEINDVGQQVSDILYHDLENVNLISISSDNRKGQSISGGFGGSNKSLGIRTTKATKKIGCMIKNKRTLIRTEI